MTDRSNLIAFFSNASEVDLRILFGVIDEIEQHIIFEYPEEERIFELFATHLWKVTAGADLVDEGRGRKFIEEEE